MTQNRKRKRLPGSSETLDAVLHHVALHAADEGESSPSDGEWADEVCLQVQTLVAGLRVRLGHPRSERTGFEENPPGAGRPVDDASQASTLFDAAHSQKADQNPSGLSEATRRRIRMLYATRGSAARARRSYRRHHHTRGHSPGVS